jgi:hypothetical protein
MARQAEAEREKRAKIIVADEGEALAAGELGRASDIMMDHPLALQLRNLQTMVEIGVDTLLAAPRRYRSRRGAADPRTGPARAGDGLEDAAPAYALERAPTICGRIR